jgi:maltose alpha-D-glucosyltransferase/alpha-amylase
MAVADATWLARQRWFRAKHRQIAGVIEVDRAALAGGQLTVLELRYVDGGPVDHYLVPLADGHDPGDGDGIWAAIGAAIGAGSRIGSFVGSPTAPVEAARPMRERRLTVEQSNTSVVLDERFILKVYRLLEPGDNPDVEVSAFLADAGFADTPRLFGSLRWEPDEGEWAAAAMLQAFVPSAGDAWGAMLGALSEDPERGLRMAASVGELTSRLHATLASRPRDPAFPVRPATVGETSEWRASAERQLAGAVAATSGHERERMLAMAPTIAARFADAFGSAGDAARVTRIHGDYHLGQLLARDDGGFSVIDFEGEPARPLAERRVPSSPLRDVAGMLRSLDYAASTAERAGALDAGLWLAHARDAFLVAYGRIGAEESRVLAAFELEKAVYEVRYEASNRPNWLWLPMAAVTRLLGER